MAVPTNGTLYGAQNFAQYTGTGTLGNMQPTRLIPQEIKKNTVNVSADVAPLLALLEDLITQNYTISNRSFFHVSGDNMSRHLTTSTSYISSDVTIVLTTGQGVRVKVGDTLLVVRTGEMLYVSGVSTDTITVSRAFSGVAATSFNSLEVLEIVSSAYVEGSSKPASKYREPKLITGYTQIIRNDLASSDNKRVAAAYGGDTWKEDWRLTLLAHNMSKEQALIMNTGANSGANQQTAGLAGLITTNYYDFAGAAMDETDLNNILMVAYRRNKSKNLICMSGENLLSTINSYGLDNIRYAPDDKAAGISIMSYNSSFGQLKLHQHGLFTASGTDVSVSTMGWPGKAYILNMEHIGLVKVKERYDKKFSAIETPGDDAKEDGLLSEIGLFMECETSQYEIDGIPAAA